jgi:uncharacterized LabA/DUF88 family protein
MNIGVYIDADNMSHKCCSKILNLVDGNYTIKKIFSDWSKTESKNWEKKIIQYGLEPIQCFRISKKQSTDVKMITTIISDIHSYNLNFIILATSDIDFSHLCLEIKKKNIKILVVCREESKLKYYCDEYYPINKLLKKK